MTSQRLACQAYRPCVDVRAAGRISLEDTVTQETCVAELPHQGLAGLIKVLPVRGQGRGWVTEMRGRPLVDVSR